MSFFFYHIADRITGKKKSPCSCCVDFKVGFIWFAFHNSFPSKQFRNCEFLDGITDDISTKQPLFFIITQGTKYCLLRNIYIHYTLSFISLINSTVLYSHHINKWACHIGDNSLKLRSNVSEDNLYTLGLKLLYTCLNLPRSCKRVWTALVIWFRSTHHKGLLSY